jgi:hypothetical protein
VRLSLECKHKLGLQSHAQKDFNLHSQLHALMIENPHCGTEVKIRAIKTTHIISYYWKWDFKNGEKQEEWRNRSRNKYPLRRMCLYLHILEFEYSLVRIHK